MLKRPAFWEKDMGYDRVLTWAIQANNYINLLVPNVAYSI